MQLAHRLSVPTQERLARRFVGTPATDMRPALLPGPITLARCLSRLSQRKVALISCTYSEMSTLVTSAVSLEPLRVVLSAMGWYDTESWLVSSIVWITGPSSPPRTSKVIE